MGKQEHLVSLMQKNVNLMSPPKLKATKLIEEFLYSLAILETSMMMVVIIHVVVADVVVDKNVVVADVGVADVVVVIIIVVDGHLVSILEAVAAVIKVIQAGNVATLVPF